MDVLLRNVRPRPNGTVDFLDTAVVCSAITIGSAANSTIQLLGRSVGTAHAVIATAGAGFKITCRHRHRVTVNGEFCVTRNLAAGDKIEVGGHHLTIIQPPAGFDCAIEVRTNSQIGASQFEAAFATDLDNTWLSKRSASWLLIAFTVSFMLAIPLWTISLHRHGSMTPRGLPDDASWSSGPLSRVHAQATRDKCAACHQTLFVQVQDNACRECHKTTHDHVSAELRESTKVGQQRCGECHREHYGAEAQLIADDDAMCVACHAHADEKFASLHVQNVAGFAPQEHAAFTVSLQKLADTSADGIVNQQWIRYRVSLAGAHEQSNLKFSHAQHLDATKVTSVTTGQALGCGDCHLPTDDGEGFLPITMNNSCSMCHQLTFDFSAPNRQLPHGKPADAILMIEDYFARKFSDPAPATTSKATRRTPDVDRDPSRNRDVDICNASAVICARQRARAEVENQFIGRGCVSCHVVLDTGSPDVHERFQVTPVRLGSDYFPDVRFNHKIHRIQGTLTGDAACEACHRARKSSEAKDLLLPELDRCLRCHRDKESSKRSAPTTPVSAADVLLSDREKDKFVTLQCISCHLYHPTAVLEAVRPTE